MTTCDILRAAQQLNYTYESEPPQVNNFCLIPIRIPIYYLIPIILIHWPGPPVELNQEEVAIEINIKEFQQRLAVLAESKTEFPVLELDNVEAARAPGVVWEVYLGLPPNAAPNPESPFFVGTMALFGAGVREHAHGDFKPAKFTFRANRAILAALRSRQEQLRLVFVPSGPLMDGKPTRPKVQSPVRIGAVNISVAREELQEPGKERPEKPPINERIQK
jgi:hypothetical protein